MKKLMVLAAVVCAAVVSQASSVNWSVTGNNTSQRNKAVYIFNASDRATIISLLEAGTTDGKAAGILANASWNPVVSGVQTSSSTSAPYVEGIKDLGEVAAGSVSYFAVVFNQSSTAAGNATRYYVSADASGHSYTDLEPGQGVAVTMSIAGVTANTIPTVAIPEPTSGLLLLLGIAGLALKRKHA